MNTDADQYSYQVCWSAEDAAYVGTVAEFPSLSWVADQQAAALAGIRTLVAEVLADGELTTQQNA